MSDDVLFTITAAHLDKGLRGFPVGTTRTSRVDPNDGVSYVGYPIADLADLEPEDVIYLMFNRELPTAAQRQELVADLQSRRGIPAHVLKTLGELPKDGHPMAWLGVGLQLLGLATRTGDWLEDARNLIARTPELIAAIYRLRSGAGPAIAPTRDKDLIADFVHMLGMPNVDAGRLTTLLKVFYVLHMDHGGGNLSTFTGKAVASGHADIYTSMSAAMGALSGPLHGGANQACLEQIREVGTTDPEQVEAYVRNKLASGGKVFGFGHGVLRAEDPRATIQYALGEKLCPNDPLFRTAAVMRVQAVKVLSENPKISNPHPNVDAVSGSLLQAGGMMDADYYTTLFGLARITGICAQIVDERVNARGGKGVPIYRPKFIAKDQEPRRR
ncbi:MAG: citrate (Si)-synthase [Myxococcota bacterium]